MNFIYFTLNELQRFEDIKSVVIRSHKYNRKTDKIMAKGLKISKGQSEAVNQRSTDSTMATRSGNVNPN